MTITEIRKATAGELVTAYVHVNVEIAKNQRQTKAQCKELKRIEERLFELGILSLKDIEVLNR